jgi:hypothetical protein
MIPQRIKQAVIQQLQKGVPTVTSDSVDTETSSVTQETLIRAKRTSDVSVASGAYENLVDTEIADNLGELDSNLQFNPNETGEYFVIASFYSTGGSSADNVRVEVRDVDAGTTIENGESLTRSPDGFVGNSVTFWVELTAGTNYEVQYINGGSSSTLSGTRNRTHLTITRSFQ